jgi:hypothetical protein
LYACAENEGDETEAQVAQPGDRQQQGPTAESQIRLLPSCAAQRPRVRP